MDKQTINNSKIQTSTNLKEGATDSKYQSSFLPIFEQAETEIKKLIVLAYWTLSSKVELKLKIQGIIEKVSKMIPQELNDRQSYIDGLYQKSERMIKKYYEKMIARFTIVSGSIVSAMVKANERPIDISTPQKLQVAINRKMITQTKLDIWSSGKGSVEIKDYSKKLKFFINDLSNDVMTTSDNDGKKPISLWQKAELDIRHEHQMEMLDKAKESGQDLYYISTHPNCSKRCEKWQGKLVSISKHSTTTGFRIGKLDGEWIYSLTDIMDQVDKYGYKNNIINGFNCRHKLIPYRKGMQPNDYTEKDVARQRKIETMMRAMEREIRKLKQRYVNFMLIGDKTNAKYIKTIIDAKTTEYKQFCERNGYAWYQYRINI